MSHRCAFLSAPHPQWLRIPHTLGAGLGMELVVKLTGYRSFRWSGSSVGTPTDKLADAIGKLTLLCFLPHDKGTWEAKANQNTIGAAVSSAADKQTEDSRLLLTSSKVQAQDQSTEELSIHPLNDDGQAHRDVTQYRDDLEGF